MPDRIPLSAVRAEGERLQFSDDEVETFIEIIADADDLFVELRSKQIARETKERADAERRRRGR